MGLDINNALNFIKEIAQRSNSTSTKTKDLDTKNFFTQADKDGDGIISSEEFENLYLSPEDFQSLEEDVQKEYEENYAKAYEAISQLDNEDGLSMLDIETAMNANDEASSSDGANRASGGSSGSNNPSGTSNKVAQETLSASALADKYSLSELTNKRSDALNQVAQQRNQKQEALGELDETINGAQEKYNEQTKAIADAIKDKDEQLSEQEQNIVDTQDLQSNLSSEVTNQQNVVTNCQTNVINIQTQISNLQSALSSLSEPPQTITNDDGQEVENPAYQTYLNQKAALEAQIAQAQAQLAQAEVELAQAQETLTSLESELMNVEVRLQEAINLYAQQETTADENITALTDGLDEQYDNLTKVKEQKTIINQEFAQAEKQAQENLEKYNQALEIEKMPSDWDEAEKMNMKEVQASELSPDYKIVDGIIYNSDGEKIGRTTTSEDGSQEEVKYFLTKNQEKENVSFEEKYNIAKQLAQNSENKEAIWQSIDLSNYSAQDIAKIMQLYDTQANNNEGNSLFLQDAAQYLNNEENSAKFSAVIDAIVKESANDEQLMKKLAQSAQDNSKVMEGIIESAKDNYGEFKKFVEKSGILADINSTELLNTFYSAIKQNVYKSGADFNIEQERIDELSANYTNAQDILDSFKNGDLTPNEAGYLIANTNDISDLIENRESLDLLLTISSADFVDFAKKMQEDEQFREYVEANNDLSKLSNVDDIISAYEKETVQDAEKFINSYLNVDVDMPISNGLFDNVNPQFATFADFIETIKIPSMKKEFLKKYEDNKELYDKLFATSNVPRIFQTLYGDKFGDKTIQKAGCGITSTAMVLSYLTGEDVTPDQLAQFGRGNNYAGAIEPSLNQYGYTKDEHNDNSKYDALEDSLAQGIPVIARYGSSSLFTNGGHFVVIVGKTEDGKYIVNDPALENYQKTNLLDGYANGFTEEEIRKGLNGVIVPVKK